MYGGDYRSMCVCVCVCVSTRIKIDECRWALVLNRMRCGKFAPLTYFGF